VLTGGRKKQFSGPLYSYRRGARKGLGRHSTGESKAVLDRQNEEPKPTAEPNDKTDMEMFCDYVWRFQEFGALLWSNSFARGQSCTRGIAR